MIAGSRLMRGTRGPRLAWALWRRLLALAPGDAPGDAHPIPATQASGTTPVLAQPASAAQSPPRDTAADTDPLAAFEAFFREHSPHIFGYLWRLTGDEQAAYDLSQETFVRAWRHFARVRDYEQPRSWLLRVATHIAWNHLKRRRTTTHVLAPLPDDEAANETAAPLASDHAAQVADSDQVRAVLLGLAPRPRAVLVLHDVYGLSSQEVARALGMTHAAAKMMLCRARERFRVRYLCEEGRP